MGKSYSVDKSYGEIAIQIEQLKYLPGQQVNGWIFLKLIKSFPATTLDLIIDGKEKAKFTEVYHTHYGNQTERHVAVYKEKHHFYGYHYEIRSHLPDQFPAGQYQYPFTFLLPMNIPSSFCHIWQEEDHKCYGKIEFVVKAAMKNHKIKKMLIHRANILLEYPLGQLSPQQQICNYTHQVKAYCGIDKGFISMTSYCQKPEYLIGENAVMMLEIDCSRMKVKINKIKCQLTEVITLRAQGHQKVLAIPASRIDLPSVQPGEIFAKERAKVVNLLIQPMGPLQPSVSGMIVGCEYLLEQICDVDRCQCSEEDVKNSIPVRVSNRPAQPFMLPVTMLDNWNPQIMPPLVCASSPANEFNDEFRKNLLMMKGKDF